MDICEAIKNAKAIGNWPVTNHEPTSVNIGYNSRESHCICKEHPQ